MSMGSCVYCICRHCIVVLASHDHCTASPSFSDLLCSYDVVFVAGVDVILQRFKDFKSRVVFSAEGFCWPDQSLAVRVGCGWGVMEESGIML